MTELAEFLNKLNTSDLIVLTIISSDRLYCRFFLKGQYTDRMYVADAILIAHITKLSGEGDSINADGVANLKSIFLAV